MTWQIISGILLLIVIFLIFYKKKRNNIEIEEARHKIELLLAQENDLNKEIQN
jgi:LPXTG-motif cell wall-anchored protein